MNEGFALYLNLDLTEQEESEQYIQRTDHVLSEVGIKYSGFRNIYLPTEDGKRDQQIYLANKKLKETEWIRNKLSHIMIMNRTDACELGDISVNGMSEPSNVKFQRYEQYYQSTHKLAHPIAVDEKCKLRDGYISYLLAVKYGLHPDIYEALSDQPVRKIVRGMHVTYRENTWENTANKSYKWIYNLREAVIPGDILQVHVNHGLAFMRVDSIYYITGKEFCREHRTVKRHTGIHMMLESKAPVTTH
jgi:hypothetical protein